MNRFTGRSLYLNIGYGPIETVHLPWTTAPVSILDGIAEVISPNPVNTVRTVYPQRQWKIIRCVDEIIDFTNLILNDKAEKTKQH